MSDRWAIQIRLDLAASAAALRLRAGVQVRVDAEVLWISGNGLPDDLERELRKLPALHRFSVADNGTLTASGKRIPSGTLPADNWQPITSWSRPSPQPAALPGRAGQSTTLRLVRADREEAASVLMTSLDRWVAWAADAPVVRLRPLAFAVASDGRTVVRGAPLPPIPGRRYVEHAGVAAPAGFALWPALDAASIRTLLKTEEADLAVFAEDGSWERIAAADFVAASRQAARTTGRRVEASVTT